jgi:hypothetical protein
VHGLELNEHVWELIDDAGADADSYADVFAAMADVLADGDFSDWENGAFLNHCGQYMRDWLACLDVLADAQPAQTAVPTPGDD